MNKKGDHKIPGYFDYVVPPLEGLWWTKDKKQVDYAHKENFSWISMIRVPDFVILKEFDWAVKAASEKKKKDFSQLSFLLMRKDFVFKPCIGVVMMMSQQQ